MQRYLSVEKMVEVEKASDQAGHTYDRMMAHAGQSLAEEVLIAYSPNFEDVRVLGLVGSGNNGGDTLVAMTHLLAHGWQCEAYIISDRGEDPLAELFTSQGGRVWRISEDQDYARLRVLVEQAEILLDGILGTGIRLPLRPPVPAVLDAVNEVLETGDAEPFVVAVDCPSGIDSDTGEAAEECIPADLTVCMAAVKQGLLKLPAYELLGELVVGEIGLDPELPEWSSIQQFVIDESVLDLIPERPLDGHKGTFGTVDVIGGAWQYPGAVLLAGKAAFRSGTGWVTLVVPESLHPHLVGDFIEATWQPLPHDGPGFSSKSADAYLKTDSKATAVLLGPGFGMEESARNFIHALVPEIKSPMVIDADGLKHLAALEQWWKKLPDGSILTPHPGEMSVLTSLTVAEIQDDRFGIAEKFAAEWGQVVVLKGAFTVVAEPSGRSAILPAATPALARAGTGDVLAGIIAGLRAQGMPAFDAACAGVWLHAQAGLLAAEILGSTAGVLAGDLIELLPSLLPE